MKDAPIGILDSGLGGLTVWREIRRELPWESTIYVGDHAYQPYSHRSTQNIRRRVRRIIEFLLAKHVKLVVIACNTATVAGIDQYRLLFSHVPIIGVVPVVKTAAAITKTKHIAVLSTPYTAASSYQKRLIQTFANGCRVENIGVPELASLIEAGGGDSEQRNIIHQTLDPLKKKNIDVIALGCTHYPFVKHLIQRIAGSRVAVIDSGGAVARHTARILDANTLRSDTGTPYTIFYSTGNAKDVTEVARKLTGQALTFTYANV